MADEVTIEDFEVPEFLENCDVETLHDKMMEELPDDIDKSQGGFPWDFTRPSANLAAELLQQKLPESLKMMFTMWAWGRYLDYKGKEAQLTRKAATNAHTVLKVTGDPGTMIPAGTLFCTEATDDSESVYFASDEFTEIGESGTAEVAVTAQDAGTGSNVNAGTIVLLDEPVDTITNVTNESAVTDAEDEEDDDSFRKRILTSNSKMELSYIGNDADSKRWSEEVSGVGHAVIVDYDDKSGRVGIILTDSSGKPASTELCQKVYDHIMRPDNPAERLAPPNYIPVVTPPELVTLSYTADIELKDGYSIDAVAEAFKSNLKSYYKSVVNEGELKRSAVFALLQNTVGVNDLKHVRVNGDIQNIPISKTQYPETGDVTFTKVVI